MNASPARPAWHSTYKVSSASRQQRILRAFRRVEHPGITALGTTRGGDLFVVIECTSATADMRARRVVVSLDLLAERVDAAAASDDFYASEAPDGSALPVAAVPRILARMMQAERLRRTP